MKNTSFTIFLLLLVVISNSLFSQVHIIGARIPGFNKSDFKYLDTITYGSEIKLDSIVNCSSNQIDSFSYCEYFRELVFKFPTDSTFRYREPLAQGQLINSKRNGLWKITKYDFYDDNKNFCHKETRQELFFNDYRLFNASYINTSDLTLDHAADIVDLNFLYQIKDTSVHMNIHCIKDSTLDFYTCILSADSIKLVNVKSDYLDEELNFLLSGEYDRKIFTNANKW